MAKKTETVSLFNQLAAYKLKPTISRITQYTGAPIIVASHSAGEALRYVLSTKSPSTSVRIDMAVDTDIHKTIGGNYIMATFGHKLVNIQISGIDLYAITVCGYSPNVKLNKSMTIQEWWDENNVQDHPDKRVRVYIPNGKKSISYDCVCVSLERVADAGRTQNDGTGTYTLTLLGVKHK